MQVTEKGNQVTVKSGQQSQTFSGVQSVTIDLGAGNDRLSLDVLGNASPTPSNKVLAGDGDDQVMVNLRSVRSSRALSSANARSRSRQAVKRVPKPLKKLDSVAMTLDSFIKFKPLKPLQLNAALHNR